MAILRLAVAFLRMARLPQAGDAENRLGYCLAQLAR
jgi:hypothetical protein